MKVNKTLLVLISSSFAGTGAGYGLDCSFAIHNETFRSDCGDLGDRREAYQTYMDGCRAYYSPEDCDREEGKRLAMSRRQPQSMVVSGCTIALQQASWFRLTLPFLVVVSKELHFGRLSQSKSTSLTAKNPFRFLGKQQRQCKWWTMGWRKYLHKSLE